MNIQDLLNKSTKYVTATLSEQEIPYRIAEIDKRQLLASNDYDQRRLNLVFKYDRLVDYTYG
jgi:flagellar biosynthesis/type III secretory pathway M-ring protein FliF/YscJ